ncbi:ORF36 protein [Operophtera brumata nucleopolyhedrovirus]|uniref:ORF36 protein n=1 Tax=Operophtera brumata nucleopolyhedrovirus TaxID=1046267 RepID=A0A2H4UZS4_9ABAC|nr:ORF36 protein [Operophtera brumata nucleopolyhedrovirus]AUA60267.1 ORF36 protein [Operophtera brumata nucleopolyhedrovirus]
MKSCRRRLVFDDVTAGPSPCQPPYKFYTDRLVKYDERYSYFIRLDVIVDITEHFDELRLVNTVYVTHASETPFTTEEEYIKFLDDYKTAIESAIMNGLRNVTQKTITRLPTKQCVSVNVYRKK